MKMEAETKPSRRNRKTKLITKKMKMKNDREENEKKITKNATPRLMLQAKRRDDRFESL